MRAFPILILTLQVAMLYGQKPLVDCKKSPMLIFDDQNKISRLHNLSIDSIAGIATLNALPEISGQSINGIGYRLQDKMVYGCQGKSLIRIDGSGTAEVLATISQGSVSGDVTPNGRYLVLSTFTYLILIDLESGSYEEKKVYFTADGPNQALPTTDIAFNPVNGVLYGFDANERTLATIDIITGKIDRSPFVVTDITTGLAALFFDSFGNLWGCGAYFNEKYFYQLSAFNGEVLAKIPIVFDLGGRLDGCSCPGAFNFQKTSYPLFASHCGVLDFIFTVSNRTGQTQSGIDLEDWMPAGVTIEKIIKNPFGGQVLSGEGTDYLLLENLAVPVGVDSIIVRVKLDNLPGGMYKNQAILKNVSIQPSQVENLLSDDPKTHILFDSTTFFVQDLQSTLQSDTRHLCPGAVIELNAMIPEGQHYLWDTGAATALIETTKIGTYLVEIQTACEAAVDTFYIVDGSVSLVLRSDTSLQIGDTILISALITSLGKFFQSEWTLTPEDPSFCNFCLEQRHSPLQDTEYNLSVTNEFGCTASEDLRVKVVRSIYVPNIFSPDGDGVNDIFLIHSKNPLTISYWQIFDRWGSLVFERHDIKTDDEANGWNPISLGRHLAAGVYTWIAEIKYPDGKKEKLIGDVTLLH